MSRIKYLLVPWLAVAVFCIGSLLSGSTGLRAYKALESEHVRIISNLEQLKRINQDLEASMDALRYDADTISMYARELGYGSEHERFIRVVGLGSARKQHLFAGQLVFVQNPQMMDTVKIQLFSLSCALVLFLFFAVSDFLRKTRD